MKTTLNQYFQPLIILSLFFISATLLTSCYGDGIEKEAKVSTLISGFAGNDAVSVDRKGIIYVSEFGIFENTGGNGTRIFKVAPNGKVLDTIKGLSGPMGTAKDSKGNLFVNNDNNTVRGEVLKIYPGGNREVVTSIDGWPSGMTIDRHDNLYISNFTAPTVHKISADGKVEIIAQDERLAGGVGIDLDSKGNIIVANFATASIYSIDKTGNVSLITTIPDIVFGGFGIGYITVINDRIYATGIAVNYIFEVSLTGETTIIAGNGEPAQVDGPLLEASFSNPNGIASDKYRGTLYITEFTGAGGLRKVSL
ncbi:hypothetical protein NBT05_05610 [Aquimarina sp. ERC-38]|uniref:hypothetical protein n=1 Tax=Aquimarina sp. ERC-38 TaxID=2949996 RepID=UPI0022475FDE|nr:hypothetical protein [Aquimarina sp. ERC-38]UZO81941.1 hypothetical protein NBT05_05610 [Aquimarina sp. ERC-38]